MREVYLDGNDIRFRLVNVGDTPATIVESRLLAEEMQGKSALRPLLTNGTNELGRLVIAPGEVRDESYRPQDSLGFSFAAQMGDRRGSVFGGDRYFSGTVVYTDDLGTRRRSVFRRRWMVRDRGFVHLDPKEERDNEYAD